MITAINRMMLVSGIYILLFLAFTQLAKGEQCSQLDESLQKTWVTAEGIPFIFTGTTLTIDIDIFTFICVEEKDGFRNYRWDLDDVPDIDVDPEIRDLFRICIKIVKHDLPGYLQIGVGEIQVTADFCTACTLHSVRPLTLRDGNYEPEPPVPLTCNKPGSCPVTNPSDVLCQTELDLFCERLMKILNGESSEEDSSAADDSSDTDVSDDFHARLLGRAKGGKKIGQLLKGMVKGIGKGRKLGHCKKRLAEEILAQCEPVPEPAIAEYRRLN